jgi:hypothetical protein
MFVPHTDPDVGAAAFELVVRLQQFPRLEDRVVLLNDLTSVSVKPGIRFISSF